MYPALTPSDTTWALQPIDDTIGKTFRADVFTELEEFLLNEVRLARTRPAPCPSLKKRVATARAVQAIFDRWTESPHRAELIKAAALRTGLDDHPGQSSSSRTEQVLHCLSALPHCPQVSFGLWQYPFRNTSSLQSGEALLPSRAGGSAVQGRGQPGWRSGGHGHGHCHLLKRRHHAHGKGAAWRLGNDHGNPPRWDRYDDNSGRSSNSPSRRAAAAPFGQPCCSD